MDVRDVVAVDDIGHVIHPVLAEGQVEGGTLQAIGYATIEGDQSCANGRYLNDRLATYIIPTSLDAPRISTILVEAPFSGAPHGAKGSGSCRWTWGAGGDRAIADATRARIIESPASPERVLAAIAGVPAIAPLPPGASSRRRGERGMSRRWTPSDRAMSAR